MEFIMRWVSKKGEVEENTISTLPKSDIVHGVDLLKFSPLEALNFELSHANDNIINEAQKILKEEEGKDIELVNYLKSLGFRHQSCIKDLENKERLRKKAKVTLEEIKKYSNMFPNHIYIQTRALVKILSKYGLYIANLGDYIGEIPRKNIYELQEFQKLYENTVFSYVDNLRIFATKKDLSPGLKFDDTTREAYRPIEHDPIIALKLGGDYSDYGYVIITKWGPEAEIEEFNI
jgi:hypothetical protein